MGAERAAEGRLVIGFIYSSLVWLTAGIGVGWLLALKFVFPELLGDVPWLQAGRIRQVHVFLPNFGFLTMGFFAALFFITPRLTGAPVHKPQLAAWGLWIWNAAMAAGTVTLMLGYTRGREWAEVVWPIDALMIFSVVLIGYSFFMTLAQRREAQLYVSLWYFLGALIWFPILFFVGKGLWTRETPYFGVSDAIVNWFMGHNILGLWITALGTGIAYYMLPILVNRPIYSHALSLVGFFGLGLFYPHVGAHHLIWGPIPGWLETWAITASALMIVPVYAVFYNFGQTMRGAWATVRDSPTLAFLLVGLAAYFISVVQGSTQAFRSMNQLVHFTQWVPGHAMLALGMGFGSVIFALVYFALPKITGRPWKSLRLLWIHFWVTTIGWVVFLVPFHIIGIIEGSMWLSGDVPFIASVEAAHPHWVIRNVGAGMIVLAQYLLVYHTVVSFVLRPKAQVATA